MISVDYQTDIWWLWKSGFNTNEIAKRMNWPEAEVDRQLWRIREEMRRENRE